MSEKRSGFWQQVRAMAAVYILWVIVSILLALCLMVAQGAITDVFRLITRNQWVVGAVGKFALFILGLVGLIIVLYAEHYLREAAAAGKLYRRFAIFFGAEAVSCGLLRLIQKLAQDALLATLK